MKIALIVAALLLVALALTQIVLSSQFSAKIADMGRRLLASQTATLPDLSLIPSIVRELAKRNGGRSGGPATASMKQDAEMRLSADQPFFRLDASQTSGTRTPGFVWQASGTMIAVVPLQIVDAYVDGGGELEVRIAGSVPVARSVGAETSKGEAMRFLAELPWNPDAILNADGLIWDQTGTSSVGVSIETSGGIARATLNFSGAGDVIGIEATDRPRAGDTPARWIGRFSDYDEVGSYRFPRFGEIAWRAMSAFGAKRTF